MGTVEHSDRGQVDGYYVDQSFVVLFLQENKQTFYHTTDVQTVVVESSENKQTRAMAVPSTSGTKSEHEVRKERSSPDLDPRRTIEVVQRLETKTKIISAVAQQVSGVNLCGAVDIGEVRVLLQEWIDSTPCPETEDEVMLVNYLTELVLDKNLEQVDLVLKFLSR